MLRVSESVVIPRPALEVFATAADPQLQLRWDAPTLTRVEKLTPGPLRPGVRYRGYGKQSGTTEYEFVEYEPGRRFTQRSALPVGEVRHAFVFEPVPEGTRLTQDAELQLNVFGSLFKTELERRLRRRLREIADEIDRYLATR